MRFNELITNLGETFNKVSEIYLFACMKQDDKFLREKDICPNFVSVHISNGKHSTMLEHYGAGINKYFDEHSFNEIFNDFCQSWPVLWVAINKIRQAN